MRFDFRNPTFANSSMADRYAAALEMVAWAEANGCAGVGVAEHHGAQDGYLPSPVTMLAAMGARTTTLRFSVGALIAPFHDPLRIAEDFCVLDNLTRGRVDIIVAGGYVHEEFAMFDVPMKERPQRVVEVVKTLKAAFTGESFEFRGRIVKITPAPYRAGGPLVLMGGSTEAAARRAARIGDGFVPPVGHLWDFYRDEVMRLGRPDPGPCPIAETQVTVVSHDPEAEWLKLAPCFEYEMNAYGAWAAVDRLDSPYHPVSGIDELRASGRYRVVSPDQLVADLKSMSVPQLALHPLCGGMPIEQAWRNLRLLEREVLPAFR
jgi:alkanesulfonate monooxygenase SsuD/methylene tetrahydromethanopterin reductase-like flavin-dependent oxidoreductase (luciferase family)